MDTVEEEVNSQSVTTDINEVAREMSGHNSELDENTTLTLEEELSSQTDTTEINDVAREMSEQNYEETSLLKITPKESNNMNINNINGSNNSIHGINCIRDINTNENDNTTITWEEGISIWIKPKTLKITRIEDDKCWRWVTYNWQSSDFNAAQLLEIYSLHVSRDYKIDTLPQGIRYEVFFWVEMLDSAFGWESPIHLRLILPDGSIQENQVILDLTPTYALGIPVGNFVMSLDMKGEVKFSLEQHENSLKGGIVVHGVFIKPSFVDIVIPRDLSINSDDVGECWL